MQCTYRVLTLSPFAAPLGTLPSAAAVASLPTLGINVPSTSTSSRAVSTPVVVAALTGSATAPSAAGVTTATPWYRIWKQQWCCLWHCPPLGAKLMTKVRSGQYVPMKELLADNVSLCAQLEALSARQQIFTGSAKPRLWEIDNPLTWVSFLLYAAVCMADVQTRNLLTYGRLIIREALRHSVPGWQEYDHIFRQQAALNQSVVWNELNPSLHAATVLSYRAGPGRVCSLCHKPNHLATSCALQVMQLHVAPQVQVPLLRQTSMSSAPGSSWKPRQETLERISVLWNRGRCTLQDCKFRHICAVCKDRGHRAKDCHLESTYKSPCTSSTKDSAGASSTPGTE